MKKTLYDTALTLLRKQHALDRKIFKAHSIRHYGDVSWYEIKSAILDEIGELNKEMKAYWCGWSSNFECEDRKIIGEFADVIHFALMAILKIEHEASDYSAARFNFAEGFSMYADLENDEINCRHIPDLEDMEAYPDRAKDLQDAIAYTDAYAIGRTLYRLGTCLSGFGVDMNDADQLADIYMGKHKINLRRVDEGY